MHIYHIKKERMECARHSTKTILCPNIWIDLLLHTEKWGGHHAPFLAMLHPLQCITNEYSVKLFSAIHPMGNTYENNHENCIMLLQIETSKKELEQKGKPMIHACIVHSAVGDKTCFTT